MKMILKGLVFFMLMAVFASGAEKVFDLQDQYFSETMVVDKKKEPKIGHYDLPNVIVDTNAKYLTKNRVYTSRGGAGFISLTLKKPVANWTYIEDRASYGYNRSYGPESVLRITSDSGNSFYVSINEKQIITNNKKFAIKKMETMNYLTNIKKQGNTFIVKINGSTLLKTTVKDFGKISKIETTIPRYNFGNSADEIKSIEIYSR